MKSNLKGKMKIYIDLAHLVRDFFILYLLFQFLVFKIL